MAINPRTSRAAASRGSDFQGQRCKGAGGDSDSSFFTYSDGQTALNAPGSVTHYGNNFASLLLDLPNQVGRDGNVCDASWRQTLYFAYFQDTWRATKAITFGYGLRWEFYPSADPRKRGGISQYNIQTNSLEVAAYGSVPKDLGMNMNAKDFEPR